MKKIFIMLAAGCAAALIAGCSDVKERKTVDPNREISAIAEEVKSLDAAGLQEMIQAYDEAIVACSKKIDAMQKELNKVKVVDINNAEANGYRAEQEAARVARQKLTEARELYKKALAALELKAAAIANPLN